jgi:4a-hydroxytetrahydrobiopterin dehydratase
MAKRPTLTEAELASALSTLDGWSIRAGKLHREFAFEDFTRAFGFMASVATVAQAMNHHPEWSNVYGRVVVDLTTHDSGGITHSDVELARRMDALAA